MTPEEIQNIIARHISEYMKNVDNLHILENYLVNQNSFLDQIAASLIRNGDFTEELSQGLAANLTPVISELIRTHENNCDFNKIADKIEAELKTHIKETQQDKKDITKMALSWVWEVFKYLVQAIIVLIGLALATDAFKK